MCYCCRPGPTQKLATIACAENALAFLNDVSYGPMCPQQGALSNQTQYEANGLPQIFADTIAR